MSGSLCKVVVAALCALLLGSVGSAVAAEATDPLFVLYASRDKEPSGPPFPPLPPGSGFEGPCGLAIGPKGNFYVADYYHQVVDVFSPVPVYQFQLAKGSVASDPCGLAVNASGDLYVNNYHRNVVMFPALTSTTFGAGTEIRDSAYSTGVAIDPETGNVYVDARTYIAVYEPSGEPLLVDEEPLRIGLGSLGDGYGVAVSGAAASKGRVYVADAADATLKVYDPAIDTEAPIETIDGHATPEGRFVSLRDAAVAVDSDNGLVYVSDDLQPVFHDSPEAAIYAFGASGAYAGRVKYNIVNARPPGLVAGRGRVYVTSGNSETAAVYAYTSGALTPGVFPAPEGLAPTLAAAPPVSDVPLASASSAAAGVAPGGSAGSAREILAPAALSPRKVRRHHRSQRQIKHRHRAMRPGRGHR